MLIAADRGLTLWTGNTALATREGDLAANTPMKIAANALRVEHGDLDEVHMEPVYYREAMTWIAAHPRQWLELEARKAFYLVVPIGPSYRLHSKLYYVTSVISYVLALG